MESSSQILSSEQLLVACTFNKQLAKYQKQCVIDIVESFGLTAAIRYYYYLILDPDDWRENFVSKKPDGRYSKAPEMCKICEFCNMKFCRYGKESIKSFEDRKHCSKQCLEMRRQYDKTQKLKIEKAKNKHKPIVIV